MNWMNFLTIADSVIIVIMLIALAVKFDDVDRKLENHDVRIKNLAKKIKKEAEYPERRLR